MAIQGKNADLYRRLRFYGFGFLLGLLAVSVIYKGRGCKMPNSVKLEELSAQKMEYSAKSDCLIKCLNLTEGELKQILKSGKVNYDVSEVHAKPYATYAVDGVTSTGSKYRITIADADTVSQVIAIVDLKSTTNSCNCE